MKQSPLLGLILTGLDSSFMSVLSDLEASKESSAYGELIADLEMKKRISTISAIVHFYTQQEQEVFDTTDFRFDLVLFCSAILASRAGGLSGCTLRIFLEYLCRELDFCGVYEKVPPRIKTEGWFEDAFKDLVVPYLSPTAIDAWDEDFVKDLGRFEEVMNLGTAYPSMTAESRGEFKAFHWDAAQPHPHPFLFGKFYNKSIGKAVFLNEIITLLDTIENCSLFLVAAPKISLMNDIYRKGYYIWRLLREDDGLHLVRMNELQGKDVSLQEELRHVICLDLSVIYSGARINNFECENSAQDQGNKRDNNSNTWNTKKKKTN